MTLRPSPARVVRSALVRVTLSLAALGAFAATSSAAVESANVAGVGSFAVADYDPWVADLWGFQDGQGREFALLCSGNKLRVLDCTDPSNIVEASVVDQPVAGSDLKDVKVFGNYAYACQEFGDVLIVDISDPYEATQVGAIPQGEICWPTPCSFELNGGCHNIWIDERGYLFLVGVHFDSTLIYDLNVDPTSPPRVGSYNPGYIHDLFVRGGIGYVANPESDANEWELVDFSDILNPVRISGMSYAGVQYAHACWPTDDGNYLLTSDEAPDGHLWVFDISDPQNPFPVAEYEAGSGSSIHNIVVVGDHAYISYYDQGLRVLDVSDPTNPIEVGHYWDDLWDDGSCSFSVYHGLWGVYAASPSGNIFVSEMCGGGLHVLDFTPANSSVPAGASLGDRIRLVASPNPAVGPVDLRASLETSGPVTVEIFDALGRRVRTLASSEPQVAGSAVWRWDGSGGSGTRVAAGVYYARLAQGRRAVLEKVVRVG